MKWMFKKIDHRKSAESTTLRKIFDLIGRFWRDILQRRDGGSNFASSKKAFAEESIFREIVILLVIYPPYVMATTPFWISNNQITQIGIDIIISGVG